MIFKKECKLDYSEGRVLFMGHTHFAKCKVKMTVVIIYFFAQQYVYTTTKTESNNNITTKVYVHSVACYIGGIRMQ